jgi:hypothetical protein
MILEQKIWDLGASTISNNYVFSRIYIRRHPLPLLPTSRDLRIGKRGLPQGFPLLHEGAGGVDH